MRPPHHLISMKLTTLISTIALPLIGAGAMAANPFPENSPLAKGKWVKIKLDKTGVYELTYDELAEMGFSNPASIGIYGRGGGLQPTQFVNPEGESYTSEMQPVALMHRDNKVYFFAQGNPKVRYFYENESREHAIRFDRESNQVFSDDVSYFITDTPDTQASVTAATGTYNTTLPALTEAWSYFYHEKDERTFTNASREFFGELFTEQRTQSLPYYIPAAVPGSSGSITCVFAGQQAKSAPLEFGFEGGASYQTTIPALGELDYYEFNTRSYATLPVPAEKGNVTIKYSPEDSSWAALDYFIVSAKRRFEFQADEPQFIVYPYEFTKKKYRGLEMPATDRQLGVWQVTNSAEVKELGCTEDEGVTRVTFLGDNHKGPVVFVDYGMEQYKISGYEEVENQNLHHLGIDKMPAMLIITLPELKPAADRLAQLHKDVDGIDVAVVLHEQVVNEFSAGVDDPMAYRAIAKMLYDRDDPNNRVFKNLLLMGPNIRDHRNKTGIVPEMGTLISNQVYSAILSDYTFCLNDWYGMLEDKTEYEQTSAATFCMVPMQIGVGIMPVQSLDAANVLVDKVAQFYADDSLAYWLGNYNYIADGGDENEHQTWQEALWQYMNAFTSSAGLGTKIYNNLTIGTGTRDQFLSKLNEGTLISYYTGHASSGGMSEYFFGMADVDRMKNRRLGVGFIGACMLAPFDNNVRGVGELMYSTPEHGFLAILCASRDGYSRHNYHLLHNMQASLLLEDPRGTLLIKSPRTLGEAYALAKNATNDNPNKFAYHLFGDPAIVLPVPTCEVSMTLDGDAATAVNPGSEVSYSGTVTDHDGNLLSDFNGTVVLKLCAPAITRTTSSRQGSEPVEVTLDQTPILVTAHEVKGGKFQGSMLVPANTPQTEGKLTARFRLSAYDPSSRLGAVGALAVNVTPYDADKVVAQDLPPVIESIYANSPEQSEAFLLPGNFIMHADITDDHGVMAYDNNGVPSLYMSIDGGNAKYDLNGYITISDSGKRVHLAYPVTNLSDGVHAIRLTASDANEQHASRSFNVRVGNTAQAAPLILDTPGPARESVTLRAEGEADMETCEVRVLDAMGQVVFIRPMTNNSLEWNLTDMKGNRVPDGVYYAIGLQTSAKLGASVTEPCEIIVLK